MTVKEKTDFLIGIADKVNELYAILFDEDDFDKKFKEVFPKEESQTVQELKAEIQKLQEEKTALETKLKEQINQKIALEKVLSKRNQLIEKLSKKL